MKSQKNVSNHKTRGRRALSAICASFIGVLLASPLFAHAQVTITNPLGETDPRLIVARVIQGALSVSGTIALLMFVYGGILWMTDMGKGEQVKKGKDIMVWAVAGIVVIASAYIVTTAIFNALGTGSVEG